MAQEVAQDNSAVSLSVVIRKRLDLQPKCVVVSGRPGQDRGVRICGTFGTVSQVTPLTQPFTFSFKLRNS